jgi:Na+-driven multidrug efflux pump
MNQSAAVSLTLLALIVLANLPFITARLFVMGPKWPERGFGWRLLELMSFGVLALLLGWFFEGQVGQRHDQGWVFYVTLLCLLLTFAFPGFAWRYLRRGHE